MWVPFRVKTVLYGTFRPSFPLRDLIRVDLTIPFPSWVAFLSWSENDLWLCLIPFTQDEERWRVTISLGREATSRSGAGMSLRWDVYFGKWYSSKGSRVDTLKRRAWEPDRGRLSNIYFRRSASTSSRLCPRLWELSRLGTRHDVRKRLRFKIHVGRSLVLSFLFVSKCMWLFYD